MTFSSPSPDACSEKVREIAELTISWQVIE